MSENQTITIIYFIGTLLVLILVVFILVYVFLHQIKVNKYNLRIQQQEINQRKELIVTSMEKLAEGELLERKRFSEELHDGISAKLTGVKMSIDYLEKNYKIENELLSKIANEVDGVIIELNEISQDLSQYILENEMLNVKIGQLLSYFNNKSHCNYSFYIENDLITKHNFTLYRLISELINNIHKHSQASEAQIEITTDGDNIILLVVDNGIGINNPRKNGRGLINIKNRVDLKNGKFIVDTSNNGTTVIIEIPI